MFGKKKQHALFNAADDTKSVVKDFRLSSTAMGFESDRPVEYPLYHKLREDEMYPKLDEYLTKLFAGELDDGNGEMLDETIFAPAREAMPILSQHNIDHNDTIRRFEVRHIADLADLRRIRNNREAEQQILKANYEKICKALEKTEEV